jgi:hypothetical protein
MTNVSPLLVDPDLLQERAFVAGSFGTVMQSGWAC